MHFRPAFRSRPAARVATWLCLLPMLFGIAAAQAETIIVGPDGKPNSLREAVRQAKDGDVIDLLAGDYRGEVVVIEQRQLMLRGVGKRPVLQAEGKVAEGKGILVVRDGEVTVENLEFRGVRAPDGNGAGIRFEKGRLKVERCAFFDNENGILTNNDPAAQLEIVDSEFGLAPRISGGLHHLLYVGKIARVSITGSRFYGGYEGHLIKSRARESRLSYNLIYDGPEGSASYEVDLPNGGLATLVGNVIGQSANSQNPVMVAYGAEGRGWDRNALYLSHNTLIGDPWLPNWFLRVFDDRLPAGSKVHAVNNITVGPGPFSLLNSGTFVGNHWSARRRVLQSVWTLEFELPYDSYLRGAVQMAGTVDGIALTPTHEFTLPIGRKPIQPPATWSPGAYQR